jgi:hypothetical protein
VQVRAPEALQRPEDGPLGGVDLRQAPCAHVLDPGRTEYALAARGVALHRERQRGAQLGRVVVSAGLSSSRHVDPLGEDAERSAGEREAGVVDVE